MRVLATRAALLLAFLAAACGPAQFVEVSGHPGKRGIDGGTDGGPPPPGPIPSLTITVDGDGGVRWIWACPDATECGIVVDPD